MGSLGRGSDLERALAPDAVEAAIRSRIAAVLPSPQGTGEISRYHRLLHDYPNRGGKRLRGRIVLLSTAAQGGQPEAGLTAAAAIELFQNWVLVHDDVEDDSDERRGKPALHKQVGAPVAINVGDGLHAYMWQLLLDDQSLPRTVLQEFLWLIHRTSEGQHLDLAWVAAGRLDVSEAEYLEMVRLKTACYTVVSPLRLGALCLGLEPDPLLTQAGESLGIAFQIRDDVLNLTAGAPYGKEFAGDLFEGKRTLILAHFFAHAGPDARQEATERLMSGRGGRTGADVEALLRLLGDAGSISYAQEVAQEYAQLGMRLLREAFADAGESHAVQALRRLLDSLASRRS